MTHQSLQQLQRDLDAAKQAAAFLRHDLPMLDTLRARVAHFVAEVALDPDNRPALEAASNELKAAVLRHAEHTAAARKVDELTSELGIVQHRERMSRIEDANKRLTTAEDEYLALGKQLIRAYRRLLEAQQQSHRVPGARTNIAPGFDFLPSTPAGWTGRTSDILRDGVLPFEQRERLEAA